MAAALYHLVYQSAATFPFSEADLEALLVQARAWNTEHQLTGVLLYCEHNIIQVLEGTQPEVEYIFGRIAQDVRHRDIFKLADGPIQQRNFSQWSMGFKAVHPEDLQYLAGYLNPTAHRYPVASATAALAPPLHELLTAFSTDDDKPIRY